MFLVSSGSVLDSPCRACALALGALLVVLLGMGVQPAVASGSSGSLVSVTDGDVAMPYETVTELTACYVDMDGSGSYNDEDTVLLAPRGDCSGKSQITDIRLTESAERSAGTRLGPTADQGVVLSSLSPEPRFYYHDRDDDNRLTDADAVYLRMHSADQNSVRTHDVRITGSEHGAAGSRVGSTDEDRNQALTSLGTAREALRQVDVLDTNTYTSHDLLYLSADTARDTAGQGDVRIFSGDPALPFGAFLGPGDPEPQDTIRTVNRYVCTVDESDTNIHNPGDPLYLSLRTQCTGTVQTGDIRLTNTTHGHAGSRVQDGDADAGGAYGVLPDARAAYLDLNEDNRLSRGDVVVLRITDPEENNLHAGDVLLTPTNRGAGTVLLDGDPLLGMTTRDLGRFDTILAFKPTSGATGIGMHDPYYLSPKGATGQGLDPLDVRLVRAGDLPFGGPVGMHTGELLSGLTRTAGAVCSTSSIPGDYIAGDPVYLRMDGACPNTVTGGLVRLVPVDEHDAFSIVRSGDNDTGRTLLAPDNSPQFRYFSMGQTGWGTTTRLYLNLVDPSQNGIQVGDIRLTPAGEDLPAGRAVLGGDLDRNVDNLNLLGNLGTYTAYVDVERSASFGTGDYAYITPTSSHEHVTPLSVRLTALPGPHQAPVLEEPSETESPTETPTSDPGPTETDTDDADPQSDDPEEEDTPGPALVLFLFACGSFIAWMRGRRR